MIPLTTASCLPSASASDRDFTVAAFNAHWGVGRFGRFQGVRFDVARVVRSFDADVVVVPEAWRDANGVGTLDALRDDGYQVETMQLMPLAIRPRGRLSDRHGVPHEGTWELAVCSRFPVLDRRLIPIGTVRRDPPGLRHALALTLVIDGTTVDVIGMHASSKFWKLAPMQHLLDAPARTRRRWAADPRRRLQLLGTARRVGDARLEAAGSGSHLPRAPSAQPDRSRSGARWDPGARR